MVRDKEHLSQILCFRMNLKPTPKFGKKISNTCHFENFHKQPSYGLFFGAHHDQDV